MTDDLWGDLPEPKEIVHPKAILREQASLLSKKTNGLLHGEVTTITPPLDIASGYDTAIHFRIVCPTLQNYRYGVLRLEYSLLEHYPVDVVNLTTDQPRRNTAADPEMLKNELRKVFQSSIVQNAISSLRREAEDEAEVAVK